MLATELSAGRLRIGFESEQVTLEQSQPADSAVLQAADRPRLDLISKKSTVFRQKSDTVRQIPTIQLQHQHRHQDRQVADDTVSTL